LRGIKNYSKDFEEIAVEVITIR